MEKRIVVTLNRRKLEEADYNKCLMVTIHSGHNSSISQAPSEWRLLSEEHQILMVKEIKLKARQA
jgi:hypothetical protein